MASDTEIARLADSVSGLRPDWNPRSVRAYLAAKHRGRSFADLAVALAVIACDPTVDTPARLEQPGPWWTATRHVAGRSSVPVVGPGRDADACRYPGHEHEPASSCRACAAERHAGDEPSRPADPAPAPAAVVAVARRHRELTTQPRPPRRDYAQPAELQQDDGRGSVVCQCGAKFVDDVAGRAAHAVVFIHQPAASAGIAS